MTNETMSIVGVVCFILFAFIVVILIASIIGSRAEKKMKKIIDEEYNSPDKE